MKKQVLSFNEFVFEAYNSAYRIMEGDSEGVNDLIEAISKLDKAGLSADAKEKLGTLSGIAKLVTTQENPDAELNLGGKMMGILDGITNEKVEITSVTSKINTIKYDNLICGNVLLKEEGSEEARTNLLDFIYLLNLNNCNQKTNIGAENGSVRWNKVQTDRRFTASMSSFRGGKSNKKFANFLASFFERDSNAKDRYKDTIYLAGSGLLGNNVITGIESGVIKLESSYATYKDMFLGGSKIKGTRDRKGFSNIKGDKSVISGYKIALPMDAKLTDAEKFPTKGASKVKKTPKAYFTLVLYTLGNTEKSEREIPFTTIELQEKMKPSDNQIVEYTMDMFTNDVNNKPVLFDVDKSTLLEGGKNNIKAAIEEFYSIESIEILGFASQEGTVDRNKTLCIERAKAVADFIKGVTDWNIPATNVTSSTIANIQPGSPETTEAKRKEWRKVQFKIKGTKKFTRPGEESYIEKVPTLSKFNPDKVDIHQIIITMEVSPRSTKVIGK